jgi:acetyltransferase
VYPVNPNYPDIEGLTCYPDLHSVPGSVDLAIVFVPAPAVPRILEACRAKGIGRVMIQSAGFAEVGDEGRALQQRCLEIARDGGIRIWGPNCMGLVDIANRACFSFMHPRIREQGLYPGPVSLVVQSGMLSAGFLADVMGQGITGIAKACSIGNKADVDECDIAEYLLQDPQTRALAMYLESVPRGRRFATIAAGAHKPIVVLLGGRSEQGARAAMSHTSSLSGNAHLAESVLRGAGVHVARDFYEMVDVAKGVALLPPIPEACRLAVLTFSGGAGILTCDLAEGRGISMGRLSRKTVDELGRVFPPWMPVGNPVDLYPALERRGRVRTYEEAFSSVLQDPAVDAILIHYFVGLEQESLDLEAMRDAAGASGKALLFWALGLRDGVSDFQGRAQALGLPVFRELSRAVDALWAARRFWRRPRS